MGKWYRCDSNASNHPKFIRAGFFGGSLVRICWEIAKEFDCVDGDITSFWQADFLGARSRLEREPNGQELISVAMSKAIESGLIFEKEGRFFIHDWNEYQMDNGAVRQKRYRAKRKDAEKIDNSKSVTSPLHNVTSPRVTVTPDNDNDIIDNDIIDNDITTYETKKTENKKVNGFSDSVMKITKSLRDAIVLWKPSHLLAEKEEFKRVAKTWAVEVDRMIRIDKRKPEEIENILSWLPTDQFWPGVIQSPRNLRKHFDTLADKAAKSGRVVESVKNEDRASIERRLQEQGWKT